MQKTKLIVLFQKNTEVSTPCVRANIQPYNPCYQHPENTPLYEPSKELKRLYTLRKQTKAPQGKAELQLKISQTLSFGPSNLAELLAIHFNHLKNIDENHVKKNLYSLRNILSKIDHTHFNKKRLLRQSFLSSARNLPPVRSTLVPMGKQYSRLKFFNFAPMLRAGLI